MAEVLASLALHDGPADPGAAAATGTGAGTGAARASGLRRTRSRAPRPTGREPGDSSPSPEPSPSPGCGSPGPSPKRPTLLQMRTLRTQISGMAAAGACEGAGPQSPKAPCSNAGTPRSLSRAMRSGSVTMRSAATLTRTRGLHNTASFRQRANPLLSSRNMLQPGAELAREREQRLKEALGESEYAARLAAREAAAEGRVQAYWALVESGGRHLAAEACEGRTESVLQRPRGGSGAEAGVEGGGGQGGGRMRLQGLRQLVQRLVALDTQPEGGCGL